MRKVARQLSTFESQEHWGRVVEVMGNEWRDAVSNMMPDEIAGRFLALMNPDLFADLRGPQGEPVVKVERETRLADRPEFSTELEERRGRSRDAGRERRRDRNERDERNVFVPRPKEARKGRYVHDHGRSGITPASGAPREKPAFPGLKKKWDRPFGHAKTGRAGSGKPRWKT